MINQVFFFQIKILLKFELVNDLSWYYNTLDLLISILRIIQNMSRIIQLYGFENMFQKTLFTLHILYLPSLLYSIISHFVLIPISSYLIRQYLGTLRKWNWSHWLRGSRDFQKLRRHKNNKQCRPTTKCGPSQDAYHQCCVFP